MGKMLAYNQVNGLLVHCLTSLIVWLVDKLSNIQRTSARLGQTKRQSNL